MIIFYDLKSCLFSKSIFKDVHCMSLLTRLSRHTWGLVLLGTAMSTKQGLKVWGGDDFCSHNRINQRHFWHEELVASQTQPLCPANKYASEQKFGVQFLETLLFCCQRAWYYILGWLFLWMVSTRDNNSYNEFPLKDEKVK